jgi:hypothetical protein
MDVRQIAEARPAVRGDHDAASSSRGRGDDQVVGATRGSRALHVGEQSGVFASDLVGVVEYRRHIQRLPQERALALRPVRIGSQKYAVEILSHHHGWHRDIIAAGDRPQGEPAFRELN